MPQKQLITTRAKNLIEQDVESKGKSSAREAYANLKTAYDKERNPYIRATLFEIMTWIGESYGTTKLASNRASTMRSGERVFLKDGKPFEVTSLPEKKPVKQEQSEHSAPIDLDDQEEEQVSLPVAEEEEEEEEQEEVQKEEEEKSEIVKSWKDEYYTLKRGRINVTYLQKSRLEWVNEVRARPDLDRNPLELQPALHKTAAQWAQVMRNRGNASHERTEGDGYYNYPKIEQWFTDKWVRFQYIKQSTFTENIGYAWFDCDEDDCTDVAVESMRRIFEFFIDEEGMAYDAHWETTIHPYYKEVGIGISVDEENNWIYMAAHYATQVIKEPVRITGS